MACHWNVMTLDVIFWNLFWSKKTSKFYGNVMTFWWNSTGFLWEKGIPVKCHENVMKFQCHSMGLKILVHFDGIFMEKVHGVVMEFDVIFHQNSDRNHQWWLFYKGAINDWTSCAVQIFVWYFHQTINLNCVLFVNKCLNDVHPELK